MLRVFNRAWAVPGRVSSDVERCRGAGGYICEPDHPPKDVDLIVSFGDTERGVKLPILS